VTPKEYQKIKGRLGLAHDKLGAMLGVSRRQSQRYALGEHAIPKCLAIVLTLIAENRLTAKEVQDYEAA